jgi:hypothetical protein
MKSNFEILVGVIMIALWIYPAFSGRWGPLPLRPSVRNLASSRPATLRIQGIVAILIGAGLIVLGLLSRH